jgi:hypothetical protein
MEYIPGTKSYRIRKGLLFAKKCCPQDRIGFYNFFENKVKLNTPQQLKDVDLRRLADHISPGLGNTECIDKLVKAIESS